MSEAFDIKKINEKRKRRNQREIILNPLLLNINGRRYRPEEINVKLTELYDVDADLDWTYPEIWDPWKRAKKHMELFNESFGEGRVSQIRFDYFLEFTHVCDVYKWFNRAYQLLKKGGVLLVSVVDFQDLCQRVVDSQDSRNSNDRKITELENLEKRIFTESDPSGMYYHRTILTRERLAYYLDLSFMHDYEFTESYNEVLDSKVLELRAIKDTNYKTKLAPDGTLIKDE